MDKPKMQCIHSPRVASTALPKAYITKDKAEEHRHQQVPLESAYRPDMEIYRQTAIITGTPYRLHCGGSITR